MQVTLLWHVNTMLMYEKFPYFSHFFIFFFAFDMRRRNNKKKFPLKLFKLLHNRWTIPMININPSRVTCVNMYLTSTYMNVFKSNSEKESKQQKVKGEQNNRKGWLHESKPGKIEVEIFNNKPSVIKVKNFDAQRLQ